MADEQATQDDQNSDDALRKRLQDAAQQRGVGYDETDFDGIKRAMSNGAGMSADDAINKQTGIYDQRAGNSLDNGQKQTATGAWTSDSGGGSEPIGNYGNSEMSDYIRQQMIARETANAGQRDDLYHTLDDRAKQSLNIDPNDPVIKAQTDAFQATQDRSSRNYLADLAEKSGPDANLRGDQRMVAEKAGQATSGFQAKLLGQELTSRRNEIAQALEQQGSMLSADQRASLQQQLALLDNSIKQRGMDLQNKGLDQDWRKAMLNNDQFLAQLGFNYWDKSNQFDTLGLQ